jgi:hypothetical protein
MHPLSDKDLDRLSREAAEQYDVEQNTSGWDRLEQKLNKHLPEAGKKERRRFLFLIWLFALLTGGGLLWMLTGNSDPQLITLKQGSSRGTLPGSENVEAGRSPENKSSNSVDPNSITAKNNKKTAKDPQAKTQNSESLQEPTPTVIIPEMQVNENKRAAQLRKTDLQKSSIEVLANHRVKATTKKNRNIISPDKAGIQTQTSVSGNPDERSSTAKMEKKAPDNSSPAEPSSPIIQNDNQDADKTPIDAAKSSITEQHQAPISDSASEAKKITLPRTKGGFLKGLHIGVVAAPDMSNVKFSNTDKIGFNVGVQLEYRLSQRWSLTTGMLYTKKNYTARGKDFNAPKGTWLDNVTLNEVEGSCFMFDIPLNVRYDLNSGSNHRYFVSMGLSTYFMKKENYDYYYQYSNGSASSRYRTYPSSDRYWFSILNLSAGFEKKLSSRFSLQAEPYLKIPLKGVGYGNIQLNSYGVYFSLKFHTKRREFGNTKALE